MKRVAIGCLAACLLAVACILNPQPIPPAGEATGNGSNDAGAVLTEPPAGDAAAASDVGVAVDGAPAAKASADAATDADTVSDTTVGPTSDADAGPDNAADAVSPVDAADIDGDAVDAPSDVASD